MKTVSDGGYTSLSHSAKRATDSQIGLNVVVILIVVLVHVLGIIAINDKDNTKSPSTQRATAMP